jgi:hypothetical protein
MNDQRARVFGEETPLPFLNGIQVVGLLAINQDRYAGEIARVCTQELVDGLVGHHTRVQGCQDVVKERKEEFGADLPGLSRPPR